MTSENTVTGRNGKFVVETTQIARSTSWSVSRTLDSSNEWGDSDSAGYTNVSAGRRGASFDTDGKYDTSSEAFDLFSPGDISIAVLWMNAVSLYFDFPRAMCNDFGLEVDIDGETVIGWTSAWKADGIYYYPGQAGATSRTLPS